MRHFSWPSSETARQLLTGTDAADSIEATCALLLPSQHNPFLPGSFLHFLLQLPCGSLPLGLLPLTKRVAQLLVSLREPVCREIICLSLQGPCLPALTQ